MDFGPPLLFNLWK